MKYLPAPYFPIGLRHHFRRMPGPVLQKTFRLPEIQIGCVETYFRIGVVCRIQKCQNSIFVPPDPVTLERAFGEKGSFRRFQSRPSTL